MNINPNHLNFETVLALKKIDLFASCATSELRVIGERAIELSFCKGECIGAEKDYCDSFYFIRKGSVRVTKKRGPTEELVRNLHEGDYFGESAVFEQELRTSSLVSDSDEVVLVKIDKESMLEALFDNPGLGVEFIKFFVKKLYALEYQRLSDHH